LGFTVLLYFTKECNYGYMHILMETWLSISIG